MSEHASEHIGRAFLAAWDEAKEARYHALLDALVALRALVEQQANDDGLWFLAATAPEAYLQQELRRLHAAIETLLRQHREEP